MPRAITTVTPELLRRVALYAPRLESGLCQAIVDEADNQS